MNLQTIDNFTRKLGLVSTLIDVVMAAILPKTKATACHSGSACWSVRGNYCYTYCWNCIERAVFDEKVHCGPGCPHCCTNPCFMYLDGGPCGPGPC